MKRFFVCRAYFKWKGKMYYKGDLLPVTFTHHDKARSIYNSRIGECEIPDEENHSAESQDATPPIQEDGKPESVPSASTSAEEPAAKPKFVFKQPLTGTPK